MYKLTNHTNRHKEELEDVDKPPGHSFIGCYIYNSHLGIKTLKTKYAFTFPLYKNETDKPWYNK